MQRPYRKSRIRRRGSDFSRGNLLDSDADGPEVLAWPTAKTGKRVKYFGKYELLSEIARGGMGLVCKARQVKLNRIVALKMILSGEFAGSDAVQRFHSEAESAANLDHADIVPIYEIGEHDSQHYFSIGFIGGPSLQGQLSAGHNFNGFVHALFWTIAPLVL